MDELANAFKTMRKYGEKMLTISQQISCGTVLKTDPRMPRTRLRRYLGQFGLRGKALRAEVERIAAGPQGKDYEVKEGVYYSWPYGWEPADFTPMMRRIFRGKSTRHVIMLDEFSRILGGWVQNGTCIDQCLAYESIMIWHASLIVVWHHNRS